jgi:hypothetical protein
MMGKGDGTFEAEQRTEIPGNMYTSLIAADLNGDAIDDLVASFAVYDEVANLFTEQSGVSIQLGSATGMSEVNSILAGSYTVFVGTPQVTAGDFNGDGWPDLAMGSFELNSTRDGVENSYLTILRGKGDGTFEDELRIREAQETVFLSTSIVASDVNNDGRSDLVLAGFSGNSNMTQLSSKVFAILGNGDVTFQEVVEVVVDDAWSARNLVIADVNDDGLTDILSIGTRPYSSSIGAINIAEGNGDGTFEIAAPIHVTTPHALGVADFDNDSSLDLGFVSYLGFQVLPQL